jgi:hypothetical protein
MIDRGMQSAMCQRLKAMGYERQKQIRMYGEEFDVISDPVPDGNGVIIGVVSRRSGKARHLRLPLSILEMVRHKASLFAA